MSEHSRASRQAPGKRSPFLILFGSVIFTCVCAGCGVLAVAAFALNWIGVPSFTAGGAAGLGDTPRAVSSDQRPVLDGATAFLQAIQNGDWILAYRLCNPVLQRELRSASDLGERVGGSRGRLGAWRVNRISGADESSRNAEAWGTGLYEGQTVPILIQFERNGAEWRVSGFRFGQ